MSVRSLVAGLAATAVAASVTTMFAVAPASADPASTPDANDIVGVGSDTTENVMDFLADGTNGVPGYNAGKTATDQLLASFDTVGSPQITLRAGSAPITRPVGSGAGKALLYGSSNNPDVTFARSSSALNPIEVANGLQAFPFAVDTLKMAVDAASTNAPAGLTAQNIVDIYKGTVTDWSQIGGKPGTINPYVPQSGSGTRSFFEAQLAATNGGTAVAYGPAVHTDMHENTDDVLKADANAVAPFSVGKAGLLFPTTIHLEDGFAPQRALYNVIRGGDLGNVTLQGIFGSNGFVCSIAAQPLVESAGFHQLATPAHGGVCGAATQAPASNFTQSSQIATSTVMSVHSTKAHVANLTATVSASTSPDGTVSFFEGSTQVAANVPLVSSQATYALSGVTPGTHIYSAVFNGSQGSYFLSSTASAGGYIKTTAKITETFPPKVAKGAHAKGQVKVALKGVALHAKGTVKIYKKHKVLAKGKLHNGKVTIKLPKLKKGKNHLKIVWKGDVHGVAKNQKFTILQK